MKPPGEMMTSETGARREDKAGKGRFDLLSPVMLRRLAILSQEGGVVHGDRNWEKGIKLSVFLDCAFRHLLQTIDGQEDEDHPIQAIWNLQGYVHTLHRIRAGLLPGELDDVPHEKNLTADLTSTEKLPTIGRGWKVKKTFTVCDGTEPLDWIDRRECRKCGYILRVVEEVDSRTIPGYKCPRCYKHIGGSVDADC